MHPTKLSNTPFKQNPFTKQILSISFSCSAATQHARVVLYCLFMLNRIPHFESLSHSNAALFLCFTTTKSNTFFFLILRVEYIISQKISRIPNLFQFPVTPQCKCTVHSLLLSPMSLVCFHRQLFSFLKLLNT